MSKGRKISVRKVLQTLVTILVVSGCTIAMLSADRLQREKSLSGVEIKIRNEGVVHFLDEPEVMDMLFTRRHLAPEHINLAALDAGRLEHIAKSNPWVGDAQVYVDNERKLHVAITQRIPVVRLFEMGGNSYYMDTALKAMPLSPRYVHYTPVVTNVPPLRDDSAGSALRGQILGLVQFITAHKFWNAQIAQVEMTADKTFELIPVLGKQRILLGDTARMAEKLDNLLAFYRQVLNKVGWDKYETLDLRYAGQVVAAPKMAWKAPVDKALSNMSWVKAIMDGATNKDDKNESFANGAGPMTDTLPVVISPQANVPAGSQAAQAPASPTPLKPSNHMYPKPGKGAAARMPGKPPQHPPAQHQPH